jgi:hypothetical protein
MLWSCNFRLTELLSLVCMYVHLLRVHTGSESCILYELGVNSGSCRQMSKVMHSEY